MSTWNQIIFATVLLASPSAFATSASTTSSVPADASTPPLLQPKLVLFQAMAALSALPKAGARLDVFNAHNARAPLFAPKTAAPLDIFNAWGIQQPPASSASHVMNPPPRRPMR